MNLFTIKDLELLSGIKAHTIRIWEQRYSFLKPQRSDSNIRFYTNLELKTILGISLLNRHGYKISHIDRMDENERCEKILALSDSEAQRERVLNQFIQHTIDLNAEEFEALLDSNINAKGIEKTVRGVVFNFLEKIGMLWQTNHINPAQERLVTNIIRQKIIVGIDEVDVIVRTQKTVLMFLPEGEHHELCLLYMYYLLKLRGIKVIYLGANVPVPDAAYIADAKKPSFIYCHLTAMARNINIEKLLVQLSTKFNNHKVIVSGQMIQDYKIKTPNNMELKKTLPDALEFINSIA